MKALQYIFVLSLFLLSSCSSEERKNDSLLNSVEVPESTLTCVTLTPDSTSLILGSLSSSFSIYDPTSGAIESFPLPHYTDGWKTYDILQLNPSEYLIAKQNCGLIYIKYAHDENDRKYIRETTQISSPSTPLPDKGTRFSTYSILRKDSIIIIGSSNGLQYLSNIDLKQLGKDSLINAHFAAPLSHMRKQKMQFSQESMFLFRDTLLTVTDHGIYKIAISDLDVENSSPIVFNPDMRCWNAAKTGDSIAVIWSPDESPDERKLTHYSLNGTRGSTKEIDPSDTWVGVYGDTLRCFGQQGNFQCFRSATMLGDYFYYIKDGVLHKNKPSDQSSDFNEVIIFQDNGYGLSNKNGIWKLDSNPTFLGELKGVSGVRNISVDHSKMYLAVADGVYSVSLSNYIYPLDRNAEIIEPNKHKSSDRMESVYAKDGVLLIGTRNGMHSLTLPSKEKKEYIFRELRDAHESPYVKNISPSQNGSFLLQTLNHGVWVLDSLNSSFCRPASLTMPVKEVSTGYSLLRPYVTLKIIMENIMIVIISLLILIALIIFIIAYIQKRHRSRLSILNLALRKERDAYNRAMEEVTNSKDALKKRQEELIILKNEYDEAKKIASKEMGLPLQAITLTLKTIISEIDTQSPIRKYLETHISRIDRYLVSNESDSETTDDAIKSYLEISTYCYDAIEASRKLADSIPESGIMKSNLIQFKEKLTEINKNKVSSLSDQLVRTVKYFKLIEDIETKILIELNNIISTATKNDSLESEKLSFLWNECILPIVTKINRYALAKERIESITDITLKNRTWILTSVTFFGISQPVVDGKKIVYNSRSLVRFENSPRNGTIFNLWANQLSDYCFMYGDASFPSSPADILWRIWLSKYNVDLSSSGRNNNAESRVTLSRGIRLAYSRMHNIPLPEDVSTALSLKSKGRPKSS